MGPRERSRNSPREESEQGERRSAGERGWGSNTAKPATVRSGAERVLAGAARRETDPRRESVLANLRGVLALEEARLGVGSTPPLRRAVGQFRRALELDSSNDDARYNLELALRLLSGAAATSAGSGQRAGTPASGAGAASTGGGY